MENYLHARFGKLGFLDRRFLSVPEPLRWSKCSPQHLDAATLDRLLPPSWIAHRFALVRHPEDRIVSVYLFQRDIERRIRPDLDFPTWLAGLGARRATEPHLLDNHPRPATDLVPPDAEIFRLEDGMAPLMDWFDRIEGTARGPRKMPQVNGYRAGLDRSGTDPGPAPDVTGAARRLIADLYADDFTRFGYTPRPAGAPGSVAAAAPRGEEPA